MRDTLTEFLSKVVILTRPRIRNSRAKSLPAGFTKHEFGSVWTTGPPPPRGGMERNGKKKIRQRASSTSCSAPHFEVITQFDGLDKGGEGGVDGGCDAGLFSEFSDCAVDCAYLGAPFRQYVLEH